MDISAITAAITGINGAVNLAKNAIGARDQQLLDKAETELTKQLLQVSQTALALVGENATLVQQNGKLEEENRKLKDFSGDLSNYELYRTAEGGLCYRAKPEVPEAQLAVHLCANCIAEGVKTFLQPINGGFHLECRRGHGSLPSDQRPDYSAERVARADYDPYG